MNMVSNKKEQHDNMLSPDEVREEYNRTVGEKYKGAYEYNRWFVAPLKKAGYDMTRQALAYHLLNNTSFSDCLELGPGAGTWTKLLIEAFPNARYDLVDISSAMLKAARQALPEDANVRIFESNFLEFLPEKKYNLFFSSRVLEYIPDKQKATQKITELLKSDGKGYLVTKMPHYKRDKLLGKKISKLHTGQITPKELKNLLQAQELQDISFYPVTVSVPLLRLPLLNLFLHRIVYRRRLNWFSSFFCESYTVKFRKK